MGSMGFAKFIGGSYLKMIVAAGPGPIIEPIFSILGCISLMCIPFPRLSTVSMVIQMKSNKTIAKHLQVLRMKDIFNYIT